MTRVTALRARRARVDIFCRSFTSRPIAASIRRPGLDDAPDERDVLLFDLTVAKLTGELLVRAIVLGHDHQPRCAAIEPMHDARTQLPADTTEVGDVVEQRVDQGPARVAGRRMDDHPGWLVEHHDIRILEEDAQRQRLGFWRGSGRRGDIDRELLARADRRARPQRITRAGDPCLP